LVVLIPLEQVQEERWSYSYNWAATFERLQGRIDSAIQTVEEANDELEADLKNRAQDVVNKLMNMTETPGLPSEEEVEQMDDAQYRIYERRVARLTKLYNHIESVEKPLTILEPTILHKFSEFVDNPDTTVRNVDSIEDIDLTYDEIQQLVNEFIHMSADVQSQSRDQSQ
jgi:hypothetical protein